MRCASDRRSDAARLIWRASKKGSSLAEAQAGVRQLAEKGLYPKVDFFAVTAYHYLRILGGRDPDGARHGGDLHAVARLARQAGHPEPEHLGPLDAAEDGLCRGPDRVQAACADDALVGRDHGHLRAVRDARRLLAPERRFPALGPA